MKSELCELDELQVTVIVEDSAGFDSGLLAQHGVSFLVEARYREKKMRLLFDTGQDAEPLLHNMRQLGIDPKKMDMVVLSHCHYDHSGGLMGFLQAADSQRLPGIAHPTIFRPNFTMNPLLRTHAMVPGTSSDSIEKAGGDLLLTREPLSLFPGVITSGEIEDIVEFEQDLTLKAYTLSDGRVIQDRLSDDLSLFFRLPRGLVILSGCSHPGIISIVEKAKSLTGISKVAAVIGGFHLISADDQRINETLNVFKAMDDAEVYTGHCTGFKASCVLSANLKERFHKLQTGLKINF